MTSARARGSAPPWAGGAGVRRGMAKPDITSLRLAWRPNAIIVWCRDVGPCDLFVAW